MIRLFRAAAAFLALPVFAAAAAAEPIEFFQVDGVEYASGIPAPEDAFGYGVGDHPVRYSDLTHYLRDLAGRSDRISVETIGYSHERRPILFFVVTSADNHARLDDIREAHRARLAGQTAPDAAPMVLWINFGVHGAESSGLDAAIPTLYHFAAAQGEHVEATLENAVLLFTVAFNPDGHTRRIDHVERFSGAVSNTDASHEVHNLWATARTNHYWFDLNRQWLLLTQPESRAWVAKWHEWKPMVSADYHEMGSDSPFYFHPGEPLRRNPLIPARARELTYEIGRRHAEFFDSEARLYTSEERFDNFYIGKGSTYPQVNGSLGILFEIGAARGGAIQTERGLVTHGDNVRTQFRTVLTTIQGSLDLRDEITAYQRDFFSGAAREAERDNRQAYVFTAEGDPERAARFVRLLRAHDIEVTRLTRDINAGGRVYRAGEAYAVPLRQKQYRMIRGVFERVTEFEENIFYDVSGWTMPLAYNLDYAAVSGGIFQPGIAGEPAEGEFRSAAAPDRAPYGYIFDWSHTYAPRALNRVLEAGLMARAATEEFDVVTTSGVQEFGRGSIFVPLARQDMTPARIHELMETIAREDGVPVAAARSGLTPVTGRDLGATNVFRIVRRPRVVLAIDDGVSWNDAGEVWWTLDYQHRMPVTLVSRNRLSSLDWSEYTHLILVNGGTLDEAMTNGLRRWIRELGGTVIATRNTALWAQREFLESAGPDSAGNGEAGGAPRFDYSEMSLRDAEHVIGGAIFETDVDVSHPLGFGFTRRMLPVNRNTSFTLARPAGDPYAVPVQYADAPLLSGYASQRRQEEIAGTPAVVSQRMGRGAVVLMADNPVFRATYPGSERLLMNAIFMSGLIDRPRGVYDDE